MPLTVGFLFKSRDCQNLGAMGMQQYQPQRKVYCHTLQRNSAKCAFFEFMQVEELPKSPSRYIRSQPSSDTQLLILRVAAWCTSCIYSNNMPRCTLFGVHCILRLFLCPSSFGAVWPRVFARNHIVGQLSFLTCRACRRCTGHGRLRQGWQEGPAVGQGSGEGPS